ncbi:hypothetical protein C2E23DRAFT_108580 [Lenzites betulinus]|nr:hypothetical protein C2E23DRAFT_108580 [Lenzites betulinus]
MKASSGSSSNESEVPEAAGGGAPLPGYLNQMRNWQTFGRAPSEGSTRSSSTVTSGVARPEDGRPSPFQFLSYPDRPDCTDPPRVGKARTKDRRSLAWRPRRWTALGESHGPRRPWRVEAWGASRRSALPHGGHDVMLLASEKGAPQRLAVRGVPEQVMGNTSSGGHTCSRCMLACTGAFGPEQRPGAAVRLAPLRYLRPPLVEGKATAVPTPALQQDAVHP